MLLAWYRVIIFKSTEASVPFATCFLLSSLLILLPTHLLCFHFSFLLPPHIYFSLTIISISISLLPLLTYLFFLLFSLSPLLLFTCPFLPPPPPTLLWKEGEEKFSIIRACTQVQAAYCFLQTSTSVALCKDEHFWSLRLAMNCAVYPRSFCHCRQFSTEQVGIDIIVSRIYKGTCQSPQIS